MTGPARLRVLIVEDNDLVNAMLVEACREWGHDVVGVADAVSAAAVLDEAPFDMLIVDYRLPRGISGEEVLRHYRFCNPRGAALVISGAPLPSEPPANPVRFLQKPFTLARLADALSSLVPMSRLRAVA